MIKRKLEQQQLHKGLVVKQQDMQARIHQAQTHIDDHGQRLEAMRQKLELWVEDKPQESPEVSWPVYSVSDADVEVALLREKQQRSAS